MVATSSHDPEKVIFYFSSPEITSCEKGLLSKGFCFAIPPRKIDYCGYLADYKLLYRSTTDLSMTTEDKKHFKAKLKDIALPSYKISNENCKYENNVSSQELSSLKTLMRNKNIVKQKADKGNTTVIIDKEKFILGIKNVISNSSKFTPLNFPPENYINYIANIEKKFRQLLNSLFDNNKISKNELLKIYPIGLRPGILYGNPKVNKLVVNNMLKFPNSFCY